MTDLQVALLIAMFLIGIVLTIAAAWSMGRAYAIAHYERTQRAIGQDYTEMSIQFERLAREMSRSDQMRAGINLGQESILHEIESLVGHMRASLNERLSEEVTDG